MNLIPRLALLLPIALLIQVASCQSKETPQVKSSKPAVVQATKDTFWVDVRTPDEFNAGHLPEATNIPLQVFLQEFPARIPQKDAIIALYCRSGNRSGQALIQAQQMGYSKAFNAGGYATLSAQRK